MNLKIVYVLGIIVLALAARTVAAEEAAAPAVKGAEPAKEEKKKPSVDSAVSFVLATPEVQKWKQSLESKNDGEFIAAWGEAMKDVAEKQCPSIDVVHKTDGENEGPHICECAEVAVAAGRPSGDPQVWVHFCVTAGGNILFEKRPRNPNDEITYMLYDDWKSKCRPTGTAPGNC